MKILHLVNSSNGGNKIYLNSKIFYRQYEASKHQTVDSLIFCFAKTFPYASSIAIEKRENGMQIFSLHKHNKNEDELIKA